MKLKKTLDKAVDCASKAVLPLVCPHHQEARIAFRKFIAANIVNVKICDLDWCTMTGEWFIELEAVSRHDDEPCVTLSHRMALQPTKDGIAKVIQAAKVMENAAWRASHTVGYVWESEVME